MRYLSVCSGIEAASVAWHHLGWTPVGFSEIEPFPSAVLAHRFPAVPNYGDMTRFQEWPIEPGTIDVLVGGTPCQSFSVAGLRKGLADPRGNLMLTYLAIAARLKPQWCVWENVPGVLSSNGGRDFGTFLGALGELGYGWAYRVLDAQYMRVGRWPRAVPQRRRRVFVVGRLLERGAGDWTAAAKAVLIPEGMRRYIEASGKTRKNATADAEGGAGGGGIFTSHRVAPCLETTSNDYSRADGFTMVAGTLGNRGLRSHTELDGHGAYIPVAQPVPYDLFQITAPVNRQNRKPGDPCHTLARDNAAHAAVASTMTVRRLSARECERLQGFPDDWTLIPWRGKPAEQCPDGPRYKALGNSMACNCMAWIGERIASHDSKRRVD
jgi:DNA (cytosine-5)-methyltransferase 1